MYREACELLEKQFSQNLEFVKNDPYYVLFMEEKKRHSYQVAGVGNGILKHVDFFKTKSAEFVEMAQTAILLHDICRFKELSLRFEGKSGDHGVMGADFLQKIPPFDDLRIVLPIRHHGHMIEDFYQDEDYLAVKDPKMREEIEQILFAIRDADKMANWKSVSYELDRYFDVWFPCTLHGQTDQSFLSQDLWNGFLESKLVKGVFKRSCLEIIFSTLCWLFDLNYAYSVHYAQKLELFEHLYGLLKTFGLDEKKQQVVQENVKEYILKKFNQVI